MEDEDIAGVRGGFQGALAGLGIGPDRYLALNSAIDRSVEAVSRARAILNADEELVGSGQDVVAFGSLARFELTPNSDLDYLIVHDLPPEEFSPEAARLSVDRIRSKLIDGVTLQEPSSRGVFGVSINRDEIRSNIGLNLDTNENMTRRVLFLEESVSLLDPVLRTQFLRSIIMRYLELRNPGSKKVPRVLLNDIIRYWRTVAVDYHAKSSEQQLRYSLRYLKLLIPRKLCFMAAIAPLYALSVRSVDGMEDEAELLLRAFAKPPVQRLAELFLDLQSQVPDRAAVDSVRESAYKIFNTLDFFVERSSDASWRSAIAEECGSGDPRKSPEFGAMRTIGHELHSELGRLAVSDAMLPFVREYLIC